ncbi:MAG: hypothetical protein IJ730_07810 [Alphaproteobacteria bacterium]|nr:hypothetical protein [Alphaproteobacteria bacterium]
MSKCFWMVFLLCFETIAMDSGKVFFNILDKAKKDGYPPSQLISELKQIRTTSVQADAFLNRYGGAEFNEEGEIRFFSNDISREIDRVARSLGEYYYKMGNESWEDNGSLLFANRLLSSSSYSPCIGRSEANSSVTKERLEHMVEDRVNFAKSFEDLEKELKGIDFEIPQKIFEELRDHIEKSAEGS